MLLIATADGGREIQIGGTAEHALGLADDLNRNAELAMVIRRKQQAT